MSVKPEWQRLRTGALAVALVLGLVALPAVGQDGVTEVTPETAATWAESTLTFESQGLWFVELRSRPTVEGTRARVLDQEHRAFRQAAASAGLQFEERFAFQTLWNGLSIAIDPADVSTLWQIPGVQAIYPVETISIPETSTIGPELATALAMTGADVAQDDLELTGEGIRVAVMDTGIDYNHPDLGACSFLEEDGCRVVTGFDFVGDDFNAADPNNQIPDPNNDPMDCNGHGTHVAGIVGADAADESGVTGVAPGVTFGAYKVFGCVGSTFSDIMIAAMELALADDMDVLNMSIGSAFQWPQHPTSQASNRLVNRGMVVVASIGNSGANGVYSASSPGVGQKVIGVASFDNSHIDALTFIVNPSGEQVPYLPLAVTPDPPTSGDSAEVVFVGRGCLTPFDEYLADPDGKVALIVRGDCTFQEKYQRAADAGAVGVVIHNNLDGLFAGGGVTSRGIFGIAISLADGEHIRSLLDAGETVTLTWTDERELAVNPAGGLISGFSSYGLSPDLTVKPDIGAPGGLIRSTYPLALGGYATSSGTSMSSPHVAGAVALLLEAQPKTSSQAVRGILQNAADPALWSLNPGLGLLDHVHRQGAGMLDIPGAILSTVRVEPGKLSLGASTAGPVTETLRISNSGTEAVTLDLSFVNAVSTGGSTFAPGFFGSNASVAFSAPTVTVPAGGTTTVDATITPATGPNLGQYGGYIVLTPQGGGDTVRVPYAGFVGDYQSILVLNPDAGLGLGNPILRPDDPDDGFTFGPSGPVTFNPDADEIVWVAVSLHHQVRYLRMQVFDANTGRNWHRAFNADYHGRSAGFSTFFIIPWDGTTVRGGSGRTLDLPDGEYVIELTVLKALGDASNPAHIESWTSPVITIDRSP